MKELNIIKYIGLNDLDDIERSKLTKIIESKYEKIHRLINNIANLVVTIKLYNDNHKNDEKKKYSIHIRIEAPTVQFSAEDFDWEIGKAINKTVNKIINEIEHRFKK